LSPVLNIRLTTFFCAVGLALSTYLALLKLFALPCIGPGHCGAVIHSIYGSVYGVPVGVFGTLLWSAAILLSDRTKRGALLVLLALGSAGFMVVQFLVLRGFCLYCTMHALSAFAAAYLHRYPPRRWAFAGGLALACAGFALARHEVKAQSQASANHPPMANLLDTTKALPWLGAIAPKSPALVISLNCPACLDLLDELGRQSYAQREVGPALYFKTTNENRALNLAFIAAVYSQAGSRREAFLAVTALFLTHKDTALSAPALAAAQLQALFPDSSSHLADAEQALAVQTSALERALIADTTPLLVTPQGQAHPFFKVDELFPK
jgi:uncharacterized membrane protein